MNVTVVDASAIAAFLFQETFAGAIEARIQDRRLIAPSLLPFEFANACVTNARRFPEKRKMFLQALETFYQLAIATHDVDLESVFDMAEIHRLTAYDSSYLWLALELGAELVTLDAKLERVYAQFARR